MMTVQTQINKVRVHSAAKQEAALKLWLAAALNSADLRPAGAPPPAVLIVRHLSDPKPGRLALDGTSLRPDAAWETAVRHTLSAYYQQAARPERGYLPSGANAVLFADESELLACLALDLARGEARQKWWWQVPLRVLPADTLAALTASWCEKAIYIPAAVAHLTAWGQADKVLSRLTDGQSERLLAALAAVYKLPALLPPPAPVSNPAARVIDEPENGRSAPPLPPALPQPERAAPSWMALWGGQREPDGLTPLQRYLWRWAVSLHHNPGAARRPACQQAAQQWLAMQSQTPGIPQKKQSSPPPIEPEPFASTPAAAGQPTLPGTDPSPAFSTAVSPPHLASPTEPSLSATAPPTVQHFLETTPAIPESLAEIEQETAVSPNPNAAISPPLPDRASPAPVSWTDGAPTRLAGIFYLINVMQRLGLPACFDESWALGQQLSPWAALELLARGLLANADEAIAADPVWLALAQLDGRTEPGRSGRLPGTPPGANFQGADQYELPPAWRSELDEHDVWVWGSKGNYYRLWSEKGFLLCHQPLASGQQARAAAAAWMQQAKHHSRPILTRGRFADTPLESGETPLRHDLSPDLNRWLACVLPFIRYWLSKAVAEPGDPSSLFLMRDGRLHLSRSHVDIVMPLNSISLPIRLAGLDVDPGWLPDYGRVVQFHYEA